MTSLGPWFGGRSGLTDPWFGSVDILDPFRATLSGRSDRDDDTSALANARVDWRETNDAHIFRADLPGVRREEVKVQVEDDNILQISGERTKEEEVETDKWHRVERRRGSYVRRSRLPENANLDEIKCGLENGVLTVVVPKKEAEPSQKNVRQIDVA